MTISGRAAASRIDGFTGFRARSRASTAAYSAGHAEDLVPRLEAVDLGADRLDRAGHVDAQDGGEGMTGMGGRAGPDLGVERVYGTGRDFHQDLARPWRGLWCFNRLKGAHWAVDDHGFHNVILVLE
jgi:hypothetical protein